MKNKLFVILGSILIILSIILYFTGDYLLEQFIVNNAVNVNVDDEISKKSDELIPDYNEDNVESLSAMTILKYKDDMNRSIAKGRIVIDSIDLNLKIHEGLNNANLLKGACEQLPRSEMRMGDVGNYILAAHCSRYDRNFMFTSLRHLKSGDEIKVSDDKNVYVYKVNFVKKVHRNDTTLINESTNDKLITLYTCYDVNHFYPQYRIVARGTLDRTIER